MTEQTTLPYAGTQGYAGSQTSERRARREASDGTAAKRQRAVLSWLADRQAYGATWSEVGEYHGWHHGQSSSVLSVLHRAGRIDRLDERRGRSAVYVMPEWVLDRPTAQPRSQQKQVDTELVNDLRTAANEVLHGQPPGTWVSRVAGLMRVAADALENP